MPEFCPREECGFQLVNNSGCLHCPACGWNSREYADEKESEYVEQTQQ